MMFVRGNVEWNMREEIIDHLMSLHTRAVDARNGYKEAVEDADENGLTSLFGDMICLHTRNADQLAQTLLAAGGVQDERGSFMSTIHRTIMNIRSLFGGLGQSVLPGLIDGEERNRSSYDEILKIPALPPSVAGLLSAQRTDIEAAIERMKAMKELNRKPAANT
jgi:uncharacterized protein (TIGR02284 family)